MARTSSPFRHRPSESTATCTRSGVLPAYLPFSQIPHPVGWEKIVTGRTATEEELSWARSPFAGYRPKLVWARKNPTSPVNKEIRASRIIGVGLFSGNDPIRTAMDQLAVSQVEAIRERQIVRHQSAKGATERSRRTDDLVGDGKSSAEGAQEFSPGWSVAEPWVSVEKRGVALKERKSLSARSPWKLGRYMAGRGDSTRRRIALFRSFRAGCIFNSDTRVPLRFTLG